MGVQALAPPPGLRPLQYAQLTSVSLLPGPFVDAVCAHRPRFVTGHVSNGLPTRSAFKLDYPPDDLNSLIRFGSRPVPLALIIRDDPVAGSGWPPSRVVDLDFRGLGMTVARLAGRVAGVPRVQVSFLDRRDGFLLVREPGGRAAIRP